MNDRSNDLLAAGAKLSMDGPGAWREDLGFCHNVFVERLWRSVKYEHVYKYAYASVSDARAKIASYLDSSALPCAFTPPWLHLSFGKCGSDEPSNCCWQ